MTRVHGLTIAVSIAVHAVLAGGLSWLALRTLSQDASPPAHAEPGPSLGQRGSAASAVRLPAAGDDVLVEEEPTEPANSVGEPPRVSAGEEVPHLDTTAAGQGGELRASTPALNLADRDEHLRLSPDLLSRLDRDQLQRIRAAKDRRSWEDRRATTHPMELTLIATGSGHVLERREPAPTDPSRGVLQAPRAGMLGSEIGSAAVAPAAAEDEVRRGGAQEGSSAGSPGVGLFQAPAGVDHRSSAPIASARPDVTRAAVAVPAPVSARPRDNVDSDQEVATTVRALVHASSAGGLAGDGRGGAGGGGESGAGDVAGSGSRARPLGFGEGDLFDYWTTDPRLVPYFRRIHAKLDPLWADAFPKQALYELKQGTVILEFTVFADGHVAVSWPPVRPSGISEFDRNCADAIRRASPLPPIPKEL
ncbi:MAG: energy transducer TonB, partial [Myxococcales bacterium]|nr:energy transducer TonB [Myxococcales bacterium]